MLLIFQVVVILCIFGSDTDSSTAQRETNGRSTPRSKISTVLNSNVTYKNDIITRTSKCEPTNDKKPTISPHTITNKERTPRMLNFSSPRSPSTLHHNKKCLSHSCHHRPNLKHHPLYGVNPKDAIKSFRSKLPNLKGDRGYIEELVTNISVVLHTSNSENRTDKSQEVINLLRDVADKLSDVLGHPENATDADIEATGYNLVFGVRNINFKLFNGYHFPNTLNGNWTSSEFVDLPNNIFNFVNRTGRAYGKIVSMIFEPVKQMNEDAIKSNSIIYEKVISTSIVPKLKKDLHHDHVIRLYFQKGNNTQEVDHECVFWNYTLSKWSTNGCRVDDGISNETYVVCNCVHLTDFSILMRVRENNLSTIDQKALHWITVIGCGISSTFLLLTIFVILSSSALRNQDRYKIHINLSISLIFGNLLLLSVDKIKENKETCITFAVLMYYFYMSSFCWMLCEGVFIYRALIRVFTERDRFIWYAILGWVLPLAIVAACAITLEIEMIDTYSCWLSWRNHAVWGFVVPAIIIIIINAIVILTSLGVTMKHVKQTKEGTFKTYVRLTFFLLPIFGTTWIFGILAFHKDLKLFQYIFAILNSLQGFFIFVFYICCSREVRKHLLGTKVSIFAESQIFPTKGHGNLSTAQT
ncbi:adhesion G-protein coupled receptor D1-like isoform X1 [Hydractinia symbiolongicarpus]|uniref:adhesion G-protein coupled receptor D1-like isoform X1 n=2 Tax=Hydractinia symbiolongicarpus TaxID=13093 RepID=UPI0025508B43|nr:adhesion G-protein coupled receptor D1-like isoform X1 [Hydractinia symbiolongicarpus]